jgi:hypothetical protein
MEVVKQITKEQLEKVVSQQKDLTAILTNLGILETQKHGLLHKIADLNKEVEDFKFELEQEYGPVNISLEDGSYTEVEKETEA